MTDKQKSLIVYTAYTLIIIFIGIFIVSIIITILQPTFFPERNIDGFKDIMSITSTILGFFSAGMAIYSLWSTAKGAKELKEALIESERRLSLKVDGLQNSEKYEQNTEGSVIKRGNGYDRVK